MSFLSIRMMGDWFSPQIRGSASVNKRAKNKARIDEMLQSMPSRWKKELEAARKEQRSLGLPETPPNPSVDDVIETVLEITAGERMPGSSRWAGPRGAEEVIVYDDIMEEAMRGLELSYKHNYPSWKFIGLARAMQLATRCKIWERSQRRAREYLRRHQKDKAGRNFGREDKPSDGYMAYLNWGGEPAWETWRKEPS